MNEKSKGAWYILVSAFFFSLMAVLVKSIPEVSVATKMFSRNFIGLIAVSFTLWRERVSIKPNRPKLMFLRSLFGLLGVFFYYMAIGRLTLTDAVILNKLSPVFVMVFAALFLKESIDSVGRKTMIMAVVGALLVVQPKFDMGVMDGVIGILSALFAGAAYTVIRRLTQFDRPILIVFYFCLFSSVVMLPWMLIEGVEPLSLLQWIALIGIGLSAFVAQYFMTTAYQKAPASEISIYAYADTVFSVVFSALIWFEFPTPLKLFGGVLIVLSGAINFAYKKRKNRLIG